MTRAGVFVVTILAVTVFTGAFGAEPQAAPPEVVPPVSQVLTEIRRSQDISENSPIDPAKVSDEQLARLGEAVMEERLGNHEFHEWMDGMMGGEDSPALDAMHRRIGYGYLRGRRGGLMPGTTGGMMGRVRFGRPRCRSADTSLIGGPMMYGPWNHMWRTGFTWGWVLMVLFGILLLAGIIALIVWLVRTAGSQTTSSSALEILKSRYARGEINKQEFEERRENLGGS